jgi:dipeptidyl aminopeptidase/acylaminoacyl peptidase
MARVGLVSCLAAGVILRLAADAAAQEQSGGKRLLGLADYYRIESATSPAISPDGTRVAFVRSRIVESENRRLSEIWLAPASGSAQAIRLTSPAFSSSAPRFSPDGRLLAFSSRRPLPGGPEPPSPDDGASVWFLRMDEPAGEAFQIEGVGGTPYFSPDNRWIAFTRKTPPTTNKSPSGSDIERRIDERFKGRIYEWLNYRFDGRGYLPDPRDPAASPPEELFVVAREGGTPRQLTRLGVDVDGVGWRPDASGLVVAANTHQRDEYTYERADLWLVPLEGEAKRLTDDGYQHEAPTFSPDGRSLVFRRELGLSRVIEAKQGKGAATDIYRLDLESGALRNLTAEWDLVPGDPAWSADGRSIAWAAEVGGETHRFRVAAARGRVERVTAGARRLAGFSVSADGTRMAFAATDPTHPSEVFSARADGGDERRLSAFSDALLREVELRPAERLAYTSHDGTKVEGWVLLPPGYDGGGGPYPLILAIHGGPHGAYGAEWSFPFQLAAARGYAVIYTNPRGSTGYGEDFLWATWGGGWGLLDSEDVLAGVDAAIAKYRIDTKRLGISGYSYGGFLTNWIIGHTTRFAAAVSGAGISNWVSDYGTADIPRTKESEFYGPPWEPRSRELLIRQSPVHYAGAIVTPTLFVHGEADLRVPIEQGEQMYVALRKRRVEARFVRYPDTYHGNWTPWNTLHRYYQELRWWDEHLAGTPLAGARSE